MADLEARRNNPLEDGSLALVLYLDLPQELLDRWLEQDDPCHVLALGRALSETLLWLLLSPDWPSRPGVEREPDVTELRDEAARALNLFLDCGTDRQAFMAEAIAGLLNTRPVGMGEPDPFAGQNARATREAEERHRLLQEAMEKRRELDAEAAIEECERLLYRPDDAA